MNYTERYEVAAKAQELAEDIERAYGRFEVNVKVTNWSAEYPRMCFWLKVKGKTRKAHLLAYAEDVQRRLKLPVFYIDERRFDVLLIVSEQEIKYPRLPAMLRDSGFVETTRKMKLPYLVGHDAMGTQVVVDLVDAPHLLLGGTTRSGKSVGLQALITSIACTKSPYRVNFIIIDAGANDLAPFNDLPHLACPVVSEKATAVRVLAALTDEMKKRRDLERNNPDEFRKLPRIVLVIDEFPALMRGNNKNTTDFLADSINNILERGRHAKVHVVLAAQNPTQRNIKVDLSNAAARIAFKCAKRNNADTIIEDCGAENLSGRGDMYLSFPGRDLQRLQGIYITRRELENTVWEVLTAWPTTTFSPEKFTISDSTIQDQQNGGDSLPSQCVSEERFAEAAYYTLGAERISANELTKVLHIGWDRADSIMDELCQMHIISAADGKLRRHVLVRCFEDVPAELMNRMARCNITPDDVRSKIETRTSSANAHSCGQP